MLNVQRVLHTQHPTKKNKRKNKWDIHLDDWNMVEIKSNREERKKKKQQQKPN